MFSAPQLLACLPLIALLTACAPSGPPIIDTPVATRAVPETAAINIDRYVAKHRGWPRSVYHIEQYPHHGGYAVFAVVHHRSQTVPPHTGGGKSFALYCDPQSYRVIKEMAFQ
jgi:hypothetical protein